MPPPGKRVNLWSYVHARVGICVLWVRMITLADPNHCLWGGEGWHRCLFLWILREERHLGDSSSLRSLVLNKRLLFPRPFLWLSVLRQMVRLTCSQNASRMSISGNRPLPGLALASVQLV